MQILDRNEYLKIEGKKCYALKIDESKDIRILAEVKCTKKGETPKVVEYGYWQKHDFTKTIGDYIEILRTNFKKWYIEQTPNAYINIFKYFDEPVILYFEKDEQTRDALKLLEPGSYIFVLPTNKFSDYLYLLIEEWCCDDAPGSEIKLYKNYNDAKQSMDEIIKNEKTEGCVHDMNQSELYDEDTSENSFECWLDGFYTKDHYTICIKPVALI